MTNDLMTLLGTFVRIADAGSISAAARQIGLSQPATSRQLARLEEHLRTQLVLRTTHSLALTDAGRQLLPDARRLLEDWEVLEERFHDSEQSVRGRLRVVAPVALGQLHLAKIACAFQLEHPELTLSWELEDEVIRFAEVGCDCWIRVGPIPDETLIVKELGQIERLLVATPSVLGERQSRRTVHQIESLPFLALGPFEGGRIPLRNEASGQERLLEPAIRWNTNNVVALKEAVLAGLGVAVLPRWFIDGELRSGRVVDVLPHWRAPRLPLRVAYLPARHRPLRLRIFLETLFREVAAAPGLVTSLERRSELD